MIKNKQVSIWRGPDPPPTLYHIWFKDEELLLRYDEVEQDWVVFLDSGQIARVIAEFIDSVDNLTINGHLITDNPVLDSSDLKVGQDGHYIKKNNTL
jgi:hypothetical protein